MLQSLKLLRLIVKEKMHLQENTLWSHEMLHSVTYAAIKFEVARSNDLGGDTFTRNVIDTWTYRRTTDRLWYKINIPFFSEEKSGYNKVLC